ncbi:hypothetical protein HHI36_023673 [Cryptolaemus montrouzieri]|uniref:Uncharacterized protein n=1 Tax=Cryptolaemus montrouzieri TaxID=559131 RepID=A0ABD2PH49_9CUCU
MNDIILQMQVQPAPVHHWKEVVIREVRSQRRRITSPARVRHNSSDDTIEIAFVNESMVLSRTSTASLECLKDALQMFDWHVVYGLANDVDAALNLFHAVFLNLFEECCPIRTLKPRKRRSHYARHG